MFLKLLTEEQKRRIAIDREEPIFKAFFIANLGALENYALNFVKDEHIAEDIASEVMWKMWHLGSDLISIVSVEAYLLRAVKNKCLNYLRVQQAHLVGHDELAAYPNADYPSPEDDYISTEKVRQIEQAIEALPPKTQQAFKLVKDENYTYKEAANIMGISTKTIDRHIQIALQKLWATIKNNLSPIGDIAISLCLIEYRLALHDVSRRGRLLFRTTKKTPGGYAFT
ncbi:sigma-70 family RNA polymerase sigma factor [Sphingobacterium sp. N143]|uniref:sigma-70 family RNA polymerase sigma factor n=1 Tax=Sphingobacterium sp. N143 TaxID=2746727 RepID=UPI0025784BE9|nr:sigma-70 family RNA polymerase sigma factor [Sphingobacterium sp. N143]MDM1296162.1 sigma-70 family RNA polymerase sigma factor [Sphingobacterium sp. N143]